MQQCIDNSQNYKSLCYGELRKMMFHIRYIGRKEVNYRLNNTIFKKCPNKHLQIFSRTRVRIITTPQIV